MTGSFLVKPRLVLLFVAGLAATPLAYADEPRPDLDIAVASGARAAALRIRTAQPDLARQVDAATAAPTRAGSYRLLGSPEGHDAAVLHLDLGLYGGESEPIRAARIRAAMVELSPDERAAVWSSPVVVVRRAAAAALTQDPGAGPELAAAIASDPDPGVREIAVASLSRLPTGGTYGPAYTLASTDPSPTVRALAVRALGWWQLTAHRAAVQAALTDVDPGVQNAARSAMVRMAP
jgi:HEAT repeat protein